MLSLTFHSITFDKSELNGEHLSRIYGKNFIHAQCYPTTYLICLNDRLKSASWSDKPDFFPLYSTLNCYLILILSEDPKSETNVCRGQVAVNIDLSVENIEVPHLSSSSSEDTVHRISDLVEKTVAFLTSLSFDKFKPIDREISQRKLIKDQADHEMSDSEFFNQQIQQVHRLNTNELQKKLTMTEDQEVPQDYVCIRPEICTSCYREMNDSISMTALKACAHWLCNDCWKQYLESSIKSIKLIRCPEWNCSSLVDAGKSTLLPWTWDMDTFLVVFCVLLGTFLSLTNIRCLNMYERQIEKCLVSLSRSYVRCGLASCSNIIQVLDPSTSTHVQCRCGHQFCPQCKEEPHFPATCRAYAAYIDELKRNGDFKSHVDEKTIVMGRNCTSCREFIEKNGLFYSSLLRIKQSHGDFLLQVAVTIWHVGAVWSSVGCALLFGGIINNQTEVGNAQEQWLICKSEFLSRNGHFRGNSTVMLSTTDISELFKGKQRWERVPNVWSVPFH